MPMTPAARVIAEELRAMAPGLREIAERLRQAEEQAAAWAKARKTIDRANAYRDGIIRTPAVPEAAPAPAAQEPEPEPVLELPPPPPLPPPVTRADGPEVERIKSYLPAAFQDGIVPDISTPAARKIARRMLRKAMNDAKASRAEPDSLNRALGIRK